MKSLDVVSRLLLSSVFIGAGVEKLRRPEQQEAYIQQLGIGRARDVRHAVAAVEIAGGAALAAGVLPGLAALALAAYLLPVTSVAHRREPVHIMKNLAIVGGLLQVAHARRRRREEAKLRSQLRPAA